jgi:hypothetical protein
MEKGGFGGYAKTHEELQSGSSPPPAANTESGAHPAMRDALPQLGHSQRTGLAQGDFCAAIQCGFTQK